ncbi:MAG: SDR family NAD(P)-dependent oxidoreductase, partial [Elusimicrobia bacterium]|nr:SDR family NAD(P)-dependent oxidoreductase [Elusimicrobiota bacterium]
GFTTDALSDIFIDIIQNHSKISGLYNVSAEPINKFDLLNIIKNSFNVKTEIAAFDDFYCDRSLDSTKFRAETGFNPLPWQTMIDKLSIDTNQYNIWRDL